MSSAVIKKGQTGNAAVSASAVAGIAEFAMIDEVVIEGNRGFVSIMVQEKVLFGDK